MATPRTCPVIVTWHHRRVGVAYRPLCLFASLTLRHGVGQILLWAKDSIHPRGFAAGARFAGPFSFRPNPGITCRRFMDVGSMCLRPRCQSLSDQPCLRRGNQQQPHPRRPLSPVRTDPRSRGSSRRRLRLKADSPLHQWPSRTGWLVLLRATTNAVTGPTPRCVNQRSAWGRCWTRFSTCPPESAAAIARMSAAPAFDWGSRAETRLAGAFCPLQSTDLGLAAGFVSRAARSRAVLTLTK
jgi:hypothetical protein